MNFRKHLLLLFYPKVVYSWDYIERLDVCEFSFFQCNMLSDLKKRIFLLHSDTVVRMFVVTSRFKTSKRFESGIADQELSFPVLLEQKIEILQKQPITLPSFTIHRLQHLKQVENVLVIDSSHITNLSWSVKDLWIVNTIFVEQFSSFSLNSLSDSVSSLEDGKYSSSLSPRNSCIGKMSRCSKILAFSRFSDVDSSGQSVRKFCFCFHFVVFFEIIDRISLSRCWWLVPGEKTI